MPTPNSSPSAHVHARPRLLASRHAACLAALLLVTGCGGGGGGSSGGAAPQALTYARDFDLVAQGTALAPNAPTVAGGAVQGWSVSPALPAGLTLDPATGVLSGTATTLTPLSSYTVRASNAVGFTEFEIELGIVARGETLVTTSVSDHTLSTYAIDADSGWLAPTGHAVTSSGSKAPRSAVAHPSGRFVFVAQRASNAISVFQHDAPTGRVSELAVSATAGSDPSQVLLSADGNVLYVISQNNVHVEAFAVSPTGSLSSLGTLALEDGAWAGELSPDGSVLWVTNVTTNTLRAVTLSPATHAPLSAGAPVSTGLAPTDVSVSRDGRFLYVNCQLGNRIDVFALDPLTGHPSRNQIQTAGNQPVAITLAPSGKFLYASGSVDSLLRTYAVDRTTGRLTELAVTPTGSRPSLLTFDTTGARLYAVASDAYEVEIFEASATTGALARSESVRTRELPLGLAILPEVATATTKSSYAYVSTSDADEVAVFSLDPQSGSLASIVDPLPSTGQRQDLAVHPSLEWVFATLANDGVVEVLSVNTHSGALVPHGLPVPTAADPIAVACDPSGERLHVLSAASATLETFGFQPATGTLTSLASLALPPAPSAVTIDPTGRFLYVARRGFDRIEVLSTDPFTAQLTHTSSLALAGEPSALAVLPNGRYLLAASGADDVVTLCELSELDGSLNPIATRPVGTLPISIASDPFGRFLYVGSRDTATVGDISILRFDPNALLTGYLSGVGTASAGQNPVAVRVDASGSYVYVAAETSRDVTRFSIERSTGLLQQPEAIGMGATPRGLALSSTRR